MINPDTYLLGRSASEQNRLSRQAAELAPETQWLLDQVNLKRGARALDVGCGPRGILDALSERVGPHGAVVGLEKSELFVEQARRFAKRRRLHNVQLVQGDAKASGLPRSSFDLVHARLVLVNVTEPENVIGEMVGLTRPGGVVASYEADFTPHLCDPPHPAWDRLFYIYQAYARSQGVDLFVGRRTHRLLRDAGLEDIQVKPVIHVFPHRHPRRNVFLDFVQNLRVPMICAGLADEAELRMLIDALREHLNDPDTLVLSHLFYVVWGRKPNGRSRRAEAVAAVP